jgi:hypothetical protein
LYVLCMSFFFIFCYLPQPPVDPLALVAARQVVKKELATITKAELTAIYEATTTAATSSTDDNGAGASGSSSSFSIEGPEVGRRALRNLCLDYLSCLSSSSSSSSCGEERMVRRRKRRKKRGWVRYFSFSLDCTCGIDSCRYS